MTILNEEWPQSNQTGHSLIKSVFDKYSEIYSDGSSSSSQQDQPNLDQIELKQIQAVNACNELFEKLNTLLLSTFQVFFSRIEKIKKNLAYIIDLKLTVHKNIDNAEFKSFLNEMFQMFREDLALKNDMVSRFMSQSRLSRESQVNIISCWLLEPFISHEVCSFQLKSYLDCSLFQ